jgi:colicin import membrane protein
LLWLKNELRKPGMPLSLGLHAAVLVASIVSFSNPKTFEDASEAISVEMVDESALRQITRGEQSAKQPQPTPRVDRVDPKPEQNAPGEAKRQVNTDNTPKPQEATAKEERKEVTAAIAPPPPIPVPRPQPPKPVEPPKIAAVAKPPKPAETTDEEEEAEEVTRQAAKKREEQKKLEDARRAEEVKKREDNRKAEEARKVEDQRRAEEARKQEAVREEQRRDQQEEARKREDQKKLTDAKAAEDRKKAEEAKKAQEAAKKAADEKKKRDAEQDAKNQATAEAARRVLQVSREPPSNSGNTGQQIQRAPAAGTPTATGQKLNPSERGALVGIIGDQIESKLYQSGAAKPRVLPQLRLQIAADGTVVSVALINSSGDPGFQALADAGIRAARQASPLRIPARFTPMYSDWRSVVVQLNPPE